MATFCLLKFSVLVMFKVYGRVFKCFTSKKFTNCTETVRKLDLWSMTFPWDNDLMNCHDFEVDFLGSHFGYNSKPIEDQLLDHKSLKLLPKITETFLIFQLHDYFILRNKGSLFVRNSTSASKRGVNTFQSKQRNQGLKFYKVSIM